MPELTLKERLAASIAANKRTTSQAPAGVPKPSRADLLGLRVTPTTAKLADKAGLGSADYEKRRKLLSDDNLAWTRPLVTEKKATTAAKVGSALGEAIIGGVTEYSKGLARDGSKQQRAVEAGVPRRDVERLVKHGEESEASDAELGRQYREFLALEQQRKAITAAARAQKKLLDAASQ